MNKYEPIDLSGLKTFSIAQRTHKVHVDAFAKLPPVGASAASLIDAMPDFLGARNFRNLIGAIVAARKADRPVVWAMGAHVIKVGCAPIVIDLIRRGIVTAVAFHGATAVHDVEVATLGNTSEEVADTIRDGSFGMVEETPAIFAEACKIAVAQRKGLGESLGKILSSLSANHVEYSVLAAAYEQGIPLSVHVAIGTDTIHMHPGVNGAMLGQATLTDFRLICSVVRDMAPVSGDVSGVWCNVGSAVLLPEVFLKAIAIARNLGANLDNITTANLDMIQHYRPTQNVTQRPVKAGHGLNVTGHHEILLPLLRQGIIEKFEQ